MKKPLFRQLWNIILNNDISVATKLKMNFTWVLMALITAGVVWVNGFKEQETTSDVADIQWSLRFLTSQTVVAILEWNKNVWNIESIKLFEQRLWLVREWWDKDWVKIEKATWEREQVLIEITKEWNSFKDFITKISDKDLTQEDINKLNQYSASIITLATKTNNILKNDSKENINDHKNEQSYNNPKIISMISDLENTRNEVLSLIDSLARKIV